MSSALSESSAPPREMRPDACACGHCALAMGPPPACPAPSHVPFLPCADCGGCGACCDYSPPPLGAEADLRRLSGLWDRFLAELGRLRAAAAPAGPRDQCRARRLRAALVAHFDAFPPEDLKESWFAKELGEEALGLADTMKDLIDAVADGFVCWVADADVVLAERLSDDEPWGPRSAPWSRP
jgi:hypothetical protein